MSSQAPLGCSPMTFSMVVSSSVSFSNGSCSRCFHKRTPLQTWWNSHIMYALDARPAPRKYRPPAKNRALSHPADCQFYRYPFSLHFRRGQFSPPTSPSQLWSLLIQVLKHNFFSGHCQNLCFIYLYYRKLTLAHFDQWSPQVFHIVGKLRISPFWWWKENYSFHPVKHQIFLDGPGQTSSMTWDCVLRSFVKFSDLIIQSYLRYFPPTCPADFHPAHPCCFPIIRQDSVYKSTEVKTRLPPHECRCIRHLCTLCWAM